MKVFELLENNDWEESPELIGITTEEEYDQVLNKVTALRHEEELLYKQYQIQVKKGSREGTRTRHKIDRILLQIRRLNDMKQDWYHHKDP